MTSDEEIISAAVLHDTIEDCSGVTEEVLALEFSPAGGPHGRRRERGQVQDMAGAKKRYDPFHRERTAGGADDRLADKLSNMRDIDRDYPKVGEELWTASA